MSGVLSRTAMTRVTLRDLVSLGTAYRAALREAAARYDRETKLYLHWTAGHYGQFFADYHVQIDADGGVYVVGDGALDALLSATYMRNSGSVSVALLCAYGATTSHLGDEPPTGAQIEAAAQTVAALAQGLWLTIDRARVMTHGEAADNEDGVYAHAPYGPRATCERWDLEYLGTAESPAFAPWADGTRGGDVLRGKAAFYMEQRVSQGGMF